jgi:hypothetical protein
MPYEEQTGDIQVYSSPIKLLTGQDPPIRIVTTALDAVDSSIPSSESSPRYREAIAKLTVTFMSSKSVHAFCARYGVDVPDICLAAWLMVLAKDGHTDSPRAEYLVSVDEISRNIVDGSTTTGVAIPRVCEAQIWGSDSALSLVQKINANRHDLGRESPSHHNSPFLSQLILSLLTFSRNTTSIFHASDLDFKAS